MSIGTVIALITVLSPVVVQLLRLINANITNAKTKAILDSAEKAVSIVEESTAAVAASNPEMAAKGREKLDAAVRIFMQDHPKIPVVEAQQILRSVLPRLGLGATAQ